MGHRRPGALPYDNVVVLPGRARHHRGVRLHRPGVVQQRQTVAGGDRALRLREREQAAGGQQVRPADEEGGRHHHGYGEFLFFFVGHFEGAWNSAFESSSERDWKRNSKRLYHRHKQGTTASTHGFALSRIN